MGLEFMTDVLIDNQASEARADRPGLGKTVSLLGVPLSYGQSLAGVHLGPGAIRVAGLVERIATLGYQVNDRGDLPIEKPRSRPKPEDKAKYLPEIYEACERLAAQTESIVDANELPITIGGDHSIAIGSLSGVVKAFRKRNERLGLIYLDALDPRDAPGSGTLVRGGLSYREAHLAMEKIAETGGMRSLEVVEINTALDENNRTSALGVELILSALGKRIL